MHGTCVSKVFAERSIEFGILNLEAFLIRPKTDEDELLPARAGRLHLHPPFRASSLTHAAYLLNCLPLGFGGRGL
jgi:hypothetical protein